MGAGEGIRDAYADHPDGAEGWYRDHGSAYRNPHEAGVRTAIGLALTRWGVDEPWGALGTARLLDLACGSGEATLALVEAGVALDRIDACDPFTSDAYRARVGREPISAWTFAEVASGAAAGRSFGAVVCTHALHLCEPSRLPMLCHALAAVTPVLLVVTPHKRPELREEWGWALAEEHRDPDTRLRTRLYRRIGSGLA